MNKEKDLGFGLICLLLVVGWIANIVQLVGAGTIATWTMVHIIKIIGIFVFPIGAVSGLVGFF